MNTYHAVAAMASNRVIGANGTIPWKLKGDLKFFKELTMGHAVIMGRKTWDSLGAYAPLPGRQNIVMSREMPCRADAEVVRSVEQADQIVVGEKAFIIGGEEIYRHFLWRCEALYLTVLESPYEGDTWMPPFAEFLPNYSVLQSRPGEAEWRHYTR